MKRAIVWLCWGERFIGQAAASARSAAGIAADRFLITDAAGAAYAKTFADFAAVITMQLAFENNLDKSRLIDLVPDGYDTFLYLDTDTRIVGDISLGFTKAEQYGIALAPAPNYNLAEYFNFAPIMTLLGDEPADQMMYNSGVVYFHLTATTRKVLERYRDLCATAGAQNDYTHDQPFLTLALEQLGVRPYVLSPLYNYRGLGEYAVGNIRLWHSHFEPPPELNTFETAWPARRFKDGVLQHADEDTADEVPPPQAMLRVPAAQARLLLPQNEVRRITTEALGIERRHGSRRANDFVLAKIGVEGSPDIDESYFAEALHYHLGLMHAHAEDPETMAPHLRTSNTMPTPEDDQLYSDHVNLSRIIKTRQLAAIKHGLPPILIACMPRSASATLTYTLGRALDIPVMHLSAGKFPKQFLVPSWLDMFLEGGAITQDHFAANTFNLGVLGGRGPREIFVLIRDPRAAARSQAHYLGNRYAPVDEPLEARIERQCIDNFIPWLQGWIDCAKNETLPFRIHWLTYGEVCRDPAGVLRKIGGILGSQNAAIAAFANCQSVKEERMHFVEGSDHAWTMEISPLTRDALWQACTADMRTMLDLKW